MFFEVNISGALNEIVSSRMNHSGNGCARTRADNHSSSQKRSTCNWGHVVLVVMEGNALQVLFYALSRSWRPLVLGCQIRPTILEQNIDLIPVWAQVQVELLPNDCCGRWARYKVNGNLGVAQALKEPNSVDCSACTSHDVNRQSRWHVENLWHGRARFNRESDLPGRHNRDGSGSTQWNLFRHIRHAARVGTSHCCWERCRRQSVTNGLQQHHRRHTASRSDLDIKCQSKWHGDSGRHG